MLLKCNGSSSDGNGYALIQGEDILLLECGVPVKTMLKSIDYQVGKVVGCLISHEHGDHAKYIRDYMKYGITTYASDEVSKQIEEIYGEKVIGLKRMKKAAISEFQVIPFPVPHNETECDGFLIYHKKIGRLLFITDAEYLPFDFRSREVNQLMVECNYSKDYICLSDGKTEHVLRGHMELETCKRLIKSIDNSGLISIGLLHLSAENGDPWRFEEEIKQLVDCDVNVYVAERGFQTELGMNPF